MSLLTKKHIEDDFFIADIFDNLPFKDDLASMEHPLFTLSFKPDIREIEYCNGDTTLRVIPSSKGLPSMMDKDFLLYCGSLVVSKMKEGQRENPEYIPPRTLRVTAHDYFKATNREDNGNSYKLFEQTLVRLRGCTITTSIKTNGKKQLDGFGLIESFRVVESSRVKNRMVALEVTLSKWFYNSIIGLELLTINPLYFRLRKPLERRLYELARKHCGTKKEWMIGIEKLHLKSGSTDVVPKLRDSLKKIITADNIPDYKFHFDPKKDMVTVTRAKAIEVDNPPREEHTTTDMVFNFKRRIKRQTLVNAEKIHNDSYTDWPIDEIIIQFITFAESKGDISNVDAAFVGFVKKKVKTFKKDSHCY